MSSKDIIERASRIVRCKLDDMDEREVDYIELSFSELLSISTALAVASALYHTDNIYD